LLYRLYGERPGVIDSGTQIGAESLLQPRFYAWSYQRLRDRKRIGDIFWRGQRFYS
jgi:hypothetical protein